MANLPVREMVLYKHGVGFFVRGGTVSGETVALTFRRDEINDVLKSLAVFDQSGGQVLGLHYQTPMDVAARLASSSIRLSDKWSLSDLLRDLRGRRVRLDVETTPGTVEAVAGRVLGLQRGPHNDGDFRSALADEFQTISLLDDAGQVRVLPFDGLRGIQVEDPLASHDLTYFLDTATAEDERRVVNVRLSPGEHDLAVYYVAPSPTWRVSYRFVGEVDGDNLAGSGKGVLQGWGLFDNRLDEDLDNVQVTLVAGQPISFVYDLYASTIPQRPTVKDQARIAPGPIAYEEADWLQSLAQRQGAGQPARLGLMATPPEEHDQQYDASVRGRTAESGRVRMAARKAPAAEDAGPAGGSLLRRIDAGQARQSTAPQTEMKETGETFQYVVTTPVSVKRGESALVPILSTDVTYERELLYNGSKFPNNPVASLRFSNATGLTLERGPVTVVENGDYKGEAVLPFTKAESGVYLPYAVELGVLVKEGRQQTGQSTTLRLGRQPGAFGRSRNPQPDAVLVHEEYFHYTTTYTLKNNTDRDLTITIEAAKVEGHELFETRAPDAETLKEQRWLVPVKAKSTAEFLRTERQRRRRVTQINQLNRADLAQYLADKWLDRAIVEDLGAYLDALEEERAAVARQEDLVREREKLYQQQQQYRENLGALQPTGKEAVLRDRFLRQLAASQDRIEATEREFKTLDETIAQIVQRQQDIMAQLVRQAQQQAQEDEDAPA